MRKNKINFTLLALAALCLSSYASLSSAQTNGGGQDGFKQPTTTLSPTTVINNGINANGGTVGGDGRVQYFYRTRTDNTCPAGMTGITTYTQKYYIRPDGSMFEEPWYLSQNDCTRNVDTEFSPGQQQDAATIISNSASNLNNIMTNMGLTAAQNQQIQSLISTAQNSGAKGAWATPTFFDNWSDSINSSNSGTNLAPGGLSLCVYGFGDNPSIRIANYIGVGAFPNPYPGWAYTSNGQAGYREVREGPICPQGSGLNYITGRSKGTPDSGGPGTGSE